MSVDIQVEEVTPAKAERWLKRNEGNRNLRNGWVNNLNNRMLRGEWQPAHSDAITFEVGGRLQNGQHRLHAVVKSGTVQTFVVMRGAAPVLQKVQDDVARRSVSDQFSMRGTPDATLLTQSAKNLYHQINNAERRILSTRLGSLTAFQVDRVLEEHLGLVASIPVGKKLAQTFSGPKALYVALHYAFSLIDKDGADTFFSKLNHGRGIKDGDPIGALRDKLIVWSRDWKKNTDAQRSEVWAVFIKAWNAYREGRPVKRLFWTSNEVWPVAK